MFMRWIGESHCSQGSRFEEGNTLSDLEERIHVIEHVEIVNATGIALE